MGNVTTWSPTAAGNDQNPPGPPDYPSENQSRSSLNNCIRENMAAVRRFADDGGWFDHGHTYAYVGATQFQAQNGDFTAIYLVGRPVRAVGTTTGTIYGTITAVSYANPHTLVTVDWDSGTLQSEALAVSVGTDPRASGLRFAQAVETGTVMMFAASALPADMVGSYLFCDGTSYPVATYPALHAVIGDTWGGDGGTNFNVPDLRGRSPLGVGQSPDSAEGGGTGTSRTLADKVGAETHTLTSSEMPAHTHTNSMTNTGIQTENAAGIPVYGYGAGGQATGSAGGGSPHNNMHPSTAIGFIIKT